MQQKVPFSLIRCSSSKVAFCSCVEWGWHIYNIVESESEPLTRRAVDLFEKEPLKGNSEVHLHTPTKFGEDRSKDLGGDREQTDRQTDKRCSIYSMIIPLSSTAEDRCTIVASRLCQVLFLYPCQWSTGAPCRLPGILSTPAKQGVPVHVKERTGMITEALQEGSQDARPRQKANTMMYYNPHIACCLGLQLPPVVELLHSLIVFVEKSTLFSKLLASYQLPSGPRQMEYGACATPLNITKPQPLSLLPYFSSLTTWLCLK